MNVSATYLKNNTGEILDFVRYKNIPAIIEKHGVPIAQIVPINTKSSTISTRAKRLAKLESLYGIMPDFPDVVALRASRKTWPTI